MAASIALCCYVHHTAMRQEQGRVDKREQRNRLQQIRWRRQQSRWPPSRLERTRLLRRQHLIRLLLLWARGIAAVAFLIIVICGYVLDWKWTGIPKRTLCDWLQLLIIPAVLAGGGLWFNRQQQERQREDNLQQQERERVFAERRSQDEALQAYPGAKRRPGGYPRARQRPGGVQTNPVVASYPHRGRAFGLRPFVADRNIRHFLWYGGIAGDGLRSVGEGPPLIQERVLYPAHRHLRAGALRGSGLYNACVVGRVVLYLLLATRPSLCAPSALQTSS